jgi:SAM-dependent methyltransferase
VVTAPAAAPEGVRCPLCGAAGEVTRRLPVGEIRAGLASCFRAEIPPDLPLQDYAMARCSRCTLGFSIPAIAGDVRFYTWIAAQTDYYPSGRSEWGDALGLMTAPASSPATLLEVGCGSGTFLDRARARGLEVFGVDLAPASVEACRRKGIRAYCGTLERFSRSADGEGRRFDYVASFHCLEHVDDPLPFVRTLTRFLVEGGRLLISTPYSPLSYEARWFDVLNHPPHHLTRWNARAYRQLAQELGLELRLHMPEAGGPLRRALRTTKLVHGGGWTAPRVDGIRGALRHPWEFVREWRRQTRRERVGARVAADVVLVELWRDRPNPPQTSREHSR